MADFIGPEAGLPALFFASFLAATLLPGGSEAALFALLKLNPQLYWPALLLATAGNTLGGMTSYALGRLVPERHARNPRLERALAWSKRHGSPALLLAWAPLIGDALCVAAGWLRLNAWAAAGFMALGKFLRYLAIAQLTV